MQSKKAKRVVSNINMRDKDQIILENLCDQIFLKKESFDSSTEKSLDDYSREELLDFLNAEDEGQSIEDLRDAAAEKNSKYKE